MSWNTVLKILIIISFAIVGLYMVMPKYSFQYTAADGKAVLIRHNTITGEIEIKK